MGNNTIDDNPYKKWVPLDNSCPQTCQCPVTPTAMLSGDVDSALKGDFDGFVAADSYNIGDILATPCDSFLPYIRNASSSSQ